MIIATSTSRGSLRVAAEELGNFYERITDEKAVLTDSLPPCGDAVFICLSGEPYSDQRVKDGSDEFSIVSVTEKNRRILVITAGRVRAALYGVYAFLEKAANCRYFWDGDVIPKADTIPLEGFDLYEAPRFEYRAIRYFAHRGLHRFQAEHWSLEDWKREIDWMLKRRLNLFMLRIGTDDLFQRAFPHIVPYPSNEEPFPESMSGYNNRTTFWSLEYRGRLRKQILDYAFERDLFHPEDCGTMTHWYSRTPLSFLQTVKPTLMQQKSVGYSEQTGLVWDIYDKKNLKNYQHLTQTHIKEFGKPEIFHTIGLAERTLSGDREEGLAIKKHAYDTVTDFVKENYPGAPILVAAWDFYFTYKAEEVRKMIRSFDPQTHVILDYSVDLKNSQNDFEQWDVVGKFPYIFGIFHGYQPQSHIHGDYAYLDQKLKVANDDPFCKGMAFWPELSHSDSFMLEYFTENSWRPDFLPMERRIQNFCQKRYGPYAETMQEIWTSFLPLYTCNKDQGYYMSSFFFLLGGSTRIVPCLLNREHPNHDKKLQIARKRTSLAKELSATIKNTVEKLANLPDALYENEFIARDATDLLRSAMEIRLDAGVLSGILAWLDGENESVVRAIGENCLSQMELFCQTLATREEFSAYHTVEKLKQVSPVNPHFENTLKDNLINGYCRSSVYESARFVFLPEMEVFFSILPSQPRNTLPDFSSEKTRIFREFLERQLSAMKPEKQSVKAVSQAILSSWKDFE